MRPDDIADFDEVVTCLPALQEGLQGSVDERACAPPRAMPVPLIVEAPVRREVVEWVARLYRRVRRPPSSA